MNFKFSRSSKYNQWFSLRYKTTCYIQTSNNKINRGKSSKITWIHSKWTNSRLNIYQNKMTELDFSNSSYRGIQSRILLILNLEIKRSFNSSNNNCTNNNNWCSLSSSSSRNNNLSWISFLNGEHWSQSQLRTGIKTLFWTSSNCQSNKSNNNFHCLNNNSQKTAFLFRS